MNLVSKRRFKYSFAFISSIFKFQVVGFYFILSICGSIILWSQNIVLFPLYGVTDQIVVHCHEFPRAIVQKVYRNNYITYIYQLLLYIYQTCLDKVLTISSNSVFSTLSLSFLLHFLVPLKKRMLVLRYFLTSYPYCGLCFVVL